MKGLLLSILFLTFSSAAHADITTGLVGWWKFDEASSGTCTGASALDSSGNSYTGTCSGSPTYVAGKIGKGALSLNGSGQYVTASGSLLNNWSSTGESASCWFQITGSMGSYGRLLEKGANNEWTIITNLSSTGYISVQQLGSNGILFTTAANYNDSHWHQLVLTISSAAFVSLYIDGTLTNSASSTMPGSLTGTLNIGQYGGGGYNWNGYIDDVRIYTRALSTSDVTQLYSYGAPLSNSHLTNARLKNFHANSH